MYVSEIRRKGNDASGAPIDLVYAKRPPDYAVYRTDIQVMVQFADDPTKEQEQRSALVKLNPLRSTIRNLIADWRVGTDEKNKAKVNAFDARVANALIAALEGDSDSASQLLQSTSDDILDDRVSRARFNYIIAAAIAFMSCVCLCALLSLGWLWKHIFDFDAPQVGSLWLAAGTGSAGALFSVVIAIRGRTVLPDLRARDNYSDAVLRVYTGAMAGALLIGFLLTNLIEFKLQSQDFHVAGSGNWLALMLAAFIGGFSERLVPDLLAKAAASDPPSKPTGTSVGSKNPVSAPSPSNPPPVAPALDPGATFDHCLASAGVTDAEATLDSELPAAMGGVAL
jgi:hypothetical protein